jgi:hypothetical protein
MKKVVLKNQDNVLNDTIEYNKSMIVEKLKSKPIPKFTIIIITIILVLIRKDKKKIREK